MARRGSDPAGRQATPEAGSRPLAVIDLGSNSGRVTVLRPGPGGHLETVSDARVPLRLARELEHNGKLGREAIERTLDALRDFQVLSRGAGADPTITVATEAIRSAPDGTDLVEAIEAELGLHVKIIEGAEEARLAFLGAVHGLPVEHGLVFDEGGGSMELSHFRDRTMLRSWSLPLGALLLSDRFLPSDPPTQKEVARLGEHVRETLAEAKVPGLADDERLVATGGTARNLAKLDREQERYPIPRLHGYTLGREGLDRLVETLAGARLAKRRQMPGLNRDRADSIVGGAVAVQALLEFVGGDEIQVSGQGLREGVAYDALHLSLPPPVEVRAASIEALAGRFATWQAEPAARRTAMALGMLRALDPEASEEVREALGHGATILDIGRSVEYYGRYVHTAEALEAADLTGFTHRQLALLCAIVRQADDESAEASLYRPLLGRDDRVPVARAATLLALADEIEHRTPPGVPAEVATERSGRSIILHVPVLVGWRHDWLDDRFERAFGHPLIISTGGIPVAPSTTA
jgi:exopolyphosphatase / guanosine-5'-triphosphate,3'-diphosphate pyrophosphatase